MADTAVRPAGSRPGRDAATIRRARRRSGLLSTLTGWGFVGPAMVVVLGLSIFPALWALVLSFQSWDGFSEAQWVGTQNYTDLVSDSEFWSAVGNTLGYTVLFVPASVLAGLFLAVALNRRIRGMAFYRTAIFVPFVASAAATGILSTYLFSPQFGLVNNVLRVLHLPQQGWLDDPKQAMLVIAIMSLWGSAAFTTVIYLAALQDVPADIIEAARIDGANRWQTFWRITLPAIRWGLTYGIVLTVARALGEFGAVIMVSSGLPGISQTLTLLVHGRYINDHNTFGAYCAATLLMAMALVTLVLMTLLERKRGTAK
jgi:multiple sugar transport system permease protein